MPRYEYKREDGSVFDVYQTMDEPHLTICPTTGQSVKKLFFVSGIRTTDTGRKKTDHNERKAGEQNLYTSMGYYKEKIEQFKDENKVPTYKEPKIVSYTK